MLKNLETDLIRPMPCHGNVCGKMQTGNINTIFQPQHSGASHLTKYASLATEQFTKSQIHFKVKCYV